jgi:acyl dehydratase
VFFEEFTVGQELLTRGRTVYDYEVGQIVALAGLYEELFVNREHYENASVFGRRVAPGLLTLCLSEGLVMSEEWFRDTGMAFLGLDELRLHAPVSPGDTIRVHVHVLEARASRQAGRGVVTAQHTVRNQEGTAVMTFRITRLVRGRPASGDTPA